jgi:hypothetical protein
MKKAIIGLVFLLLLNISSLGQVSDFEKILSNKELMQLDQNTLTRTNFADMANGKTIVLTSLVKGCKWRLEEVAFYNKLKKDYPNKFDVFVTFTDDIEITSKYIREVNFDFVYIYDPKMTLSQEFYPVDTVFSVLFDSNGNIQEKTTSGNLDRDQISKLLNIDQAKSSLKQSNNLPIINFQIKRYELGDKVSSNLSSVNIPTKIMTGFKPNEIIDTLENIKFCTLSGKNILELYSYAYDLPKSRFIYDNKLDFINSHSPDHRYTLILSVSNLHSDFNRMLIQQINLNFGLEISDVFQEKEVLILSKIDTNKGQIKIVNTLDDAKTLSENISEEQFQLSTNNITATEISKYIEEATMLPVEVRVEPKLRYSLDISFENNDRTINNLIKLFPDNGLVLEREKKEINCPKINMTDNIITNYHAP